MELSMVQSSVGVYVQSRDYAAAKDGNMSVAVVVVGPQIHEAGRT